MATVNEFLKDLREKITPIAQREREELLKLKAEEIRKLGLDADPTKLHIWVSKALCKTEKENDRRPDR